MKVSTAQQMRTIDKKAMEDLGIPGMVLMENAGLAVLSEMTNEMGSFAGKTVFIISGPGNNGGDGFVIARHLVSRGATAYVLLLADPAKLKGDALSNYLILDAIIKTGTADLELEVRPQWLSEARGIQEDRYRLMTLLLKADLVVDAVFGTGFSGELPDGVRSLSQLVSKSKCRVMSVDVPTGVDADTGSVATDAFRADVTVTFGLPKVGLVVEPGREQSGRLVIDSIGLPVSLVTGPELTINLASKDDIFAVLPARPNQAHKGTFGKTLVVAGSTGMSGAAYLSAQAAVKSGSGLVVACIPGSLNHIMEVKTTEAMSVPCPEDLDGTFALSASDEVVRRMEGATAVVLGPGLGQSKDGHLKVFVHDVLRAANSRSLPLLIDADGLNNLNTDDLVGRPNPDVPIVLTPHPGEMSRLLGFSIKDVQANRIEVARDAAARWNAVVVLKGAGTIVASPSGELYINSTGNPGMATGGTGDVLSGVIGGFLAQGMDAVKACVAGTYIHGLAGDLAKESVGMAAMTAGDLLSSLPLAFKMGLE